jgi:hypothetical protein
MKEIFSTKVTYLGKVYGVRLLKEGTPVLEVQVKDKMEIQPAIKEMLRTMDKLGYDSPMASASRLRDNHMPINKNKIIWLS